MSSLDSLDNVKYSINRFIGPVITIILGIYLYSKSVIPVEVVQSNPGGEDIVHEVIQNSLFGSAGLFFFIVGIFWLLYIFNVLKAIVAVISALVLTVLGIYILGLSTTIVKDDVDYNNKKELYFREMKGRINDIKIAQIEFKRENGAYTDNADSLIYFVNNGKTIKYVRSGVTPARALTREEADYLYPKQNIPLDNNMTDIEAKGLLNMAVPPVDLLGYVRDTVYVPVLETVFQSNSYLESRNKKLQFDFHPDSLRFIPFSGTEVRMDTASISRGELMIPTLLIEMIHPEFIEDTLRIGDLQDNSLKDNWSLK